MEITPLLLIIQADAFFLFARCFDHCAVAFDDRHVEEAVRLLLPDFDSRFVDRVHQSVDSRRRKTSTEISGSRRICPFHDECCR